MKNHAVIDIGTYSVILLIGSITGDGLHTVFQKIAAPCVWKKVSVTGLIAPEAFAALTDALEDFLVEIKKRGALLKSVAATEAFRKANNGASCLEQISKQLGISARILSGEEEARLSYFAVSSLYGQKNLWVLDIGGGSTEINTGNSCESFPIGAVESWDVFGSDLNAVYASAKMTFSKLPTLNSNVELVVVGGTATALALLEQQCTKFDAEKVEGFRATRGAISHWRQELNALSPEGKSQLMGQDSGRAEILGSGLAIWEGFLSAMGINAFRISDRGMRYGLLWESFGKA